MGLNQEFICLLQCWEGKNSHLKDIFSGLLHTPDIVISQGDKKTEKIQVFPSRNLTMYMMNEKYKQKYNMTRAQGSGNTPWEQYAWAELKSMKGICQSETIFPTQSPF